ncbi:VOC family protein [Actinokineospora bangkokensis]|uniref:VOC domain-containing protein n=1 Tax=Actinokineospora bangkokensis TaxID=1193682 RepID=A0A1Q9LT39_9PSEU|nr:VOC family protein [Actinokineospora bangkokensis]OLR95180.1 hypothetical protein BJP25_07750 [Actinokineospora bangkokensis]
MPTRMTSLVVDSADPAALARFYADLLRWSITHESADEVCVAPQDDDGFPGDLTFVPVDDPKVGVNRYHLDLSSVSAADQAAIVDRALSLGATHTDVGQGDAPWVVLADPEGNEFCVLEPRPENADTGAVACIVTLATDPSAQADFWAAATGNPIVRDTPASAVVRGDRGPWLEFLAHPEPKRTKNRLHIDVAAYEGEDQRAEVDRLLALGATHLDLGQGERSWVVLADPEGNEFCILSSRPD